MRQITRYECGNGQSRAEWDVQLTDEEIAILAAGVPPWAIQPDHLVFYEPPIALGEGL